MIQPGSVCMAEPQLAARSVPAGLSPPSMPGLTLRELPLAIMLDLRLLPEDAVARAAAEGVLDCALPEVNRCSEGNGRTVLWLGPDAFLVVAAKGDEARLAAALAPYRAAVTDVSDGRAALELAGPSVRDLLTKGCPLDLHPRVFRPGDCAQSHFGKARILLRQTDESPRYEIFVERSYVDYLWRFLIDGAREFQGTP
jgi:sarcosine oxidase subunit gamma